MNLHSATSVTADAVRASFEDAFFTARIIIEQSGCSEAKAFLLRESILEQLRETVMLIGEDTFVKPNMHEMLGAGGDPLTDWPLFVIADALWRCDEAAKRGAGGEEHDMGSIADVLERLRNRVTTELTVTKASPAEWTDGFAGEIRATVEKLNLSGVWLAEMLVDGTLAIAPESLPWTFNPIAHTIDFRLIDMVFVPATEAEAFRLTRSKLLGEKIKAAFDEVAVLLTRQQALFEG